MLSEKQLDEFVSSLPEERKESVKKLYISIAENIPSGFESSINGTFLSFDVPLSSYPAGYHCSPNSPLPFISIASQKNFIALYHMGIYADPTTLEWFQTEYPKHAKFKLDMGKSCIRFKRTDDIPFDLVAELSSKFSVDRWISAYETVIKR